MNKVHFNVQGLINVPTKTQVKNELDKLEGVQQVNVDLNRGTVEVEFNEPANSSDIQRCIEHVGCRVI
jgi:copper chaperone CopZ